MSGPETAVLELAGEETCMYESRVCVFCNPHDTWESLMPKYIQYRSYTPNNTGINFNDSDTIMNLIRIILLFLQSILS